MSHCNNGLNNHLVNSLIETKVAKETGDLKYLQDSMREFIAALSDLITGKYSDHFLEEYVGNLFNEYKSTLEESIKIPQLKEEVTLALQRLSAQDKTVRQHTDQLSQLFGDVSRLENLTSEDISTPSGLTQEQKNKYFDDFILASSTVIRPLEFFNTNESVMVGEGNPDVDSDALQNAINSGFVVDISGLKLKINRTINVDIIEACIMSSIPYQRNGSGHSKRSANIEVVDDTLDVLFNVTQYNARFSGFRVRCSTANNTTTIIKGQRSDYTKSDVDILINDMTFEYGLRAVDVKGRGLDFQRCAVVGLKDMAIRLDWDGRWVPNGQSNDENGTAQRAYTIADIRQHGCLGLIDNVGEYRHKIGNILIANIQGDTGGCIFKGVMRHTIMTNIHSYLHPVAARQLEIWDGSHDSQIIGFNMAGYFDENISRMPQGSILITPDTLGIRNIVLANGSIGASDKTPIFIDGGGELDITLSNVAFTDCARTTNEIIFARQASGKTITKWTINLQNCNFHKTDDIGPTQVINGTNTSLININRDFMTRKSGYATWANPSFTNRASVSETPSNT